jgi:hypothetical protein
VFTYFAIEHYNGEWKIPVMFVSTPLRDQIRQQIFAYRHVWVVGNNPTENTTTLLQGCPITDLHGSNNFYSVWRIK